MEERYYIDVCEVHTDAMDISDGIVKDRLLNVLDDWFEEEKIMGSRYHTHDLEDFLEKTNSALALSDRDLTVNLDIEVVSEVREVTVPVDIGAVSE